MEMLLKKETGTAKAILDQMLYEISALEKWPWPKPAAL